jgi:rfaE bifunctional protein nucleotidyltransferase chain/domain
MMGRVLSLKELVELRQGWLARGEKVVLTNGCFDLIHVGHVRYLRQARALGDVLIVGVNSDASVRRLKGKGRPLLGQEERAEVVAALEGVDYVVIFGQSTARQLVAALRPEVYVKGGDYQEGRDLPEAAEVRRYGGRVEILPLVPGRSTTELVRLVLKRQCRQGQ